MPFRFEELSLPGLFLVRPQVLEDERGYFLEVFRRSAFREAGIDVNFVQVNVSWSRQGVLRGLHYEAAPHSQAKLIRVLEGQICDVVVDVRPDSPTFGRWHKLHLDASSHEMLFIPAGYAHGFCVLSAAARVSYHVTAEYDPPSERGILWNDPELAIDWPIRNPILSRRDREWPTLAMLRAAG